MPDTFVPLVSARNQNGESPFSRLKSRPAVPAQPAQTAASGAPETPAACDSKPVITLQRNGDVVSSIRVQCACGQVIDLACVY